MLLPRIRPFGASSSRILIKRLSARSDVHYHSKVRAYPFAISKDEAINRMSIIASTRANQDILRSLGAYFLPKLGFEPFQPSRIERVYVPAWFVDAQIEADVTYPRVPGADSTPRRETFTLENSYMPGFVFDPLHRISLKHSSLLLSEPVPLSATRLEFEGSKVLCPPYTISPLALPNVIRSLSPEQCTVAGYRFDPATLVTSFLAAYPVLIPMFLAYYDVFTLDNSQGMTLMLEAYRKDGTIFVNRMSTPLYETLKPALPMHKDGQNEFLSMATPFFPKPAVPFLNVLSLAGMYGTDEHRQQRENLVQRISKLCSLKDTMEKYQRLVEKAGVKPVDFDDLRVRKFTITETADNRKYLLALLNEGFGKHLATTGRLKRNESGNGSGRLLTSPVSGINSMSGSKPGWLGQWERQQRLRATGLKARK